jgi:hypothetical protein
MITTYVRKERRYGTTVYVGYIKVCAGPVQWTQSTCIPTRTKMDALDHAEQLKAEHNRRNGATQWP